MKLFPLRKSKTLIPRSSVTMQIWFRKSKQSCRWMHFLWRLARLRCRRGRTWSCLDRCGTMLKGLAIQSCLHHDTFERLEWFWRHSTVLLDDRSIVLLFQRFLDQGGVWFCLWLAINCESGTYIDLWASRLQQQYNGLQCHPQWWQISLHPRITI